MITAEERKDCDYEKGTDKIVSTREEGTGLC